MVLTKKTHMMIRASLAFMVLFSGVVGGLSSAMTRNFPLLVLNVFFVAFGTARLIRLRYPKPDIGVTFTAPVAGECPFCNYEPGHPSLEQIAAAAMTQLEFANSMMWSVGTWRYWVGSWPWTRTRIIYARWELLPMMNGVGLLVSMGGGAYPECSAFFPLPGIPISRWNRNRYFSLKPGETKTLIVHLPIPDKEGV